MLKKGSMIQIKQMLGILLLVIAAGNILNIEQVTNIINDYPMVVNLILGASGYLFLIAGRRL